MKVMKCIYFYSLIQWKSGNQCGLSPKMENPKWMGEEDGKWQWNGVELAVTVFQCVCVCVCAGISSYIGVIFNMDKLIVTFLWSIMRLKEQSMLTKIFLPPLHLSLSLPFFWRGYLNVTLLVILFSFYLSFSILSSLFSSPPLSSLLSPF